MFLTGATGLLGGWLLEELLTAGATAVVLVRDYVPQCLAVSNKLLERAVVVHGSLLDYELLRRTMAEYAIDTVFHLGAQTLVGVAKRNPVDTLQVNVGGTWNVLEAARQTEVRNLLFASSDKAYGVSDELPYLESHPLQGIYPYDCSKSCADQICKMYALTYRVPVATVRCSNLFGGGDLNFSRAIPGVIRAILHNERFVIRSDGQFVRDFLYVKDAASAYLTLAEALANDRSLIGEAFNFSLELKLTVLEIVRRVMACMHREDLEPIIQNEASAEIREQYLSSEKARSVLGWKPQYGLNEGLRETIDWYSCYFGKTDSSLARAAIGR